MFVLLFVFSTILILFPTFSNIIVVYIFKPLSIFRFYISHHALVHFAFKNLESNINIILFIVTSELILLKTKFMKMRGSV